MVVATLVGWLAWRSLGWPLVHYAPLMHYVAWRIAEGAVPYRDLFDMNFPGVYLLHLLVVRTLGAGDLPCRSTESRSDVQHGHPGCEVQAGQ